MIKAEAQTLQRVFNALNYEGVWGAFKTGKGRDGWALQVQQGDHYFANYETVDQALAELKGYLKQLGLELTGE